MERTRIAIIGAGLAGAATAWALARRGEGDVVLIEKETFPGTHSSGRNAAMIRQLIGESEIAALAREGGRLLREPPPEFAPHVYFNRVGSLLIGSKNDLTPIYEATPQKDREALGVEWWSRERARARVPVLADVPFETALWTASDGVIDAAALLEGYLKHARKAGARIFTDCEVRGFRRTGSRLTHLETSTGEIETQVVVDAAGAWAQQVATAAGADERDLRPLRRHLFVSEPLSWADSGWPFVWDVTRGVYFRPESGGLLLCACDESEVAPGDPPQDPAVREVLAEKLAAFYPALSALSIRRSWAGLRTFTPDGKFAIGRDGRIENFFWVAGLGGHGVTTSPAVGRLAAAAILEGCRLETV